MGLQLFLTQCHVPFFESFLRLPYFDCKWLVLDFSTLPSSPSKPRGKFCSIRLALRRSEGSACRPGFEWIIRVSIFNPAGNLDGQRRVRMALWGPCHIAAPICIGSISSKSRMQTARYREGARNIITLKQPQILSSSPILYTD